VADYSRVPLGRRTGGDPPHPPVPGA
jgi:hypothetical protein